jgi:glycerol-3-phosphate dehydrogenase
MLATIAAKAHLEMGSLNGRFEMSEWTNGWRDRVWSHLDQNWDVLVIGGGITGAGILRQCRHAGLRAVLVEADDFASGTSSRSSKLVHGGLRYLKNLQIKVTLESVTEREYLLKQGRGLVNRLNFLYPRLKTDRMPGWVLLSGLIIYDLMARQWAHRSYDAEDVQRICPQLTAAGLLGGYRFYDAGTDDARLVVRLLREAAASGAAALNYARAESLLRSHAGQVCGAVVSDTSGEASRQAEIRARVVINATGVWGDRLRGELGQAPRLRPLRGSHVMIPFHRLPLTHAVMFLHPRDGRPVFAIPWEGAVVYGTTDVDHGPNLATDPAISASEKEYLLAGIQQIFPGQELTAADMMSAFAGLRPVVNTGKSDPSKESREHAIWDENGFVTVAGGKLTTFRVMARDAIKAAAKYLGPVSFDPRIPVLDPIPPDADARFGDSSLTAEQRLRLLARYGAQAVPTLCECSRDLEPIPGTACHWAELRRAARAEGVVHLDDLLLRRVRLGLLLPNGGQEQMPRIRALVQTELRWSDDRWQTEAGAYAKLWRESYCFE